jgi:hypothetical protein
MSGNIHFRISVGDDPEHEDLTAEIYYNEIYLAMISQEAGLENAVIDIQPCPDPDGWSFPLTDFMQAMKNAILRLQELRRS